MDSKYDLRRAEELVAEGRRVVQQQKGRIIRLRAAGVDTWDAQRTLHQFGAVEEETKFILLARACEAKLIEIADEFGDRRLGALPGQALASPLPGEISSGRSLGVDGVRKREVGTP
jgi:hypothetical protein